MPEAIDIEGLYKRYQLGGELIVGKTLRSALSFRSRSESRVDVDQEYFWALQGVDLNVNAGEVVGVIGRNGSGKSTLLKILARITSPTRGSARIRGRVASLLEVGTGFHPELSGRENIFLNGAVLGMSRQEIRAKFDDIVAFSEIGPFLDTPLKRYSSGMQVRLAFAVAAHLDTDILLVDEVLAVGDVDFQRRCLGKMSDLVGDGRTVLFVSHDTGAVRRLCPQCLWLDRGEVQGFGPTTEIMRGYLSGGDTQDTVIPVPNGRSPDQGNALSLSLFDENGQPARVFRGNENWTVRLRFEIKRALRDLTASVVLENSGLAVIKSYQSDPVSLEAGIYEVDFVVTDRLMPDDIKFNIFINAETRNFYWVKHIVGASISELADTSFWRAPDSPLLQPERGAVIRPARDIGEAVA